MKNFQQTDYNEIVPVLPAGYTVNPQRPFIDLSAYRGVVAAGKGPNTSPFDTVARCCSTFFAPAVYETIPLNPFTNYATRDGHYATEPRS